MLSYNLSNINNKSYMVLRDQFIISIIAVAKLREVQKRQIHQN